MKLKKVIALTMATMLSITALAGCGNGGADSSATSQSSQNDAVSESEKEATAEAEGEASETNSREKTVITVWTKDRHDAEFMQGKIDEYNASNTDNIEVVYEIYSDNYPQAVDMVFQNGDAPDMFVFQEQVFQSYYNTGKYADITPFMDDEFKEMVLV